MKKIFCLLITGFSFFSSIHSSANETNGFNLQNYIYDDTGSPVFIKIYTEFPRAKPSNQNERRVSSHQNELQCFLNRMSQEDSRGSYVVIPIKKKKSKDDDDDEDESCWECPHCGRMNKASVNRCPTPGCPFNC